MTDSRIENIVIVGDGIDGWATAAALACAFRGDRTHITVVKFPTPARPISALDDLRLFNRILGVSEQTFIQRTKATFKLGVNYVGWNGNGSEYFAPFGTIGARMEDIPFYQYWLKARLGGASTPLSDYSLSAAAALQGKFGRPANNARDAFAGLSFSLHADGAEYVDLMCDYALAKGVSYVEESTAVGASLSDNGFIDVVKLADGAHLKGDFFIDCTGVRRLLIGEALKTPFQSWRAWLPCDRVAVRMSPRDESLTPYTTVEAGMFGWMQTAPLQHGTGRTLCYARKFFSDDEAKAYLDKFDRSVESADPTLFDCEPGRMVDAWRGNCVAIGEAAGVVEDIDATRHSVMQKGVTQLVQLFPDKSCEHGEREEYNRLMSSRLDGVRDLAILHYALNGRNDSPIWTASKDKPLPDNLAYRVALFKRRGRLASFEDDPVSEAQWLSVLFGQGVTPVSCHPLVDVLPDSVLHKNLETLRRQIIDATATMVSHDLFVENASRV